MITFEKELVFPEVIYKSNTVVTEQQRQAIWDIYDVPHWANMAPYEFKTGPANHLPHQGDPDYMAKLTERVPDLIHTLLIHARAYAEECVGITLLPEDKLSIKYIGCVAVPSKGNVPAHAHFYKGPCFMTGSLCLEDGGPANDASLVFQSPKYNDTEALQTKFTENTIEHRVQPKLGDLYLWRSYLSHSLPFNPSPKPMVFLWYDVEYIRGNYPVPDACTIRGS